RAGRVLDRSPRPVDGPAAPLELQVSLAAEVRILENRAEVVENAVRVGHRAPATGRELCEAYPDDGARVESEQLAGVPVGGLDLAVAADGQDAVRGRVEDLREADPLRLRLLVEPGVLERGRELIGIGGQETRLDDAERLRRRIVEDEHAEDALVLAHDRVRGDGPDA